MRIGLIADETSLEKGTGIAKYTQKLYFYLKRKSIDVRLIHTSSPKTILGPPIKHCLTLPCQVIRYRKECDLLHAVTTITGLCFPLLLKQKIITCHDTISLSCANSGFPAHVKLFSRLFLKATKFADKIIAISTQTKADLISKLGINEEKIAIINNGIDDDLKPMLREHKPYYTIGYLGNLNRRKRVDYLIRAFWYLRKKHSDINVELSIFAKKNNDYQLLVGMVKALGLSTHIGFLGFAPNILEAYNSFDIFAFPSEYEGFGLPILEAQRCGVPVIVRADANIPKEVTEFCLKARSYEDMADKMYVLLTDECLRKKLVSKGLEYSKQFSWEKMCEKTIEVYKGTMK